MGTIDRITAHMLSAYEFNLVDKEGNKHRIHSTTGISFVCVREHHPYKIDFDQIGTDYWILAKTLNLYYFIVDGFENNDSEIMGWFNDEFVDLDESDNIYLSRLPYGAVEVLYKKHYAVDLPEGTYREMDQ